MQLLSNMLARHCEDHDYKFSLADITLDNNMVFSMVGIFPMFAYIADKTAVENLHDGKGIGVELLNDEDGLVGIRAEMSFQRPFLIQSQFLMDALEEYVISMRHKFDLGTDFTEPPSGVIPLEPLMELCASQEPTPVFSM